MPRRRDDLSELSCELVGRVALLTLNAPERRNALNTDLIEALITTLEDLERDRNVGAVVLTGASPAFCSGATLGDLAAIGASPAVRRTHLLAIYEGFLRVARSPLPIVAAVNGPAVGAGMNLALACDVRIAGQGARFDARFLSLGLHPGGGHTWMARRAMGEQAARATVLFGEKLDAHSALHCGLVWEVVHDDLLVDRAVAFAEGAASIDADLIRRAKESILATDVALTLPAAVEIEVDAQVWSMDQPAFREGPIANTQH